VRDDIIKSITKKEILKELEIKKISFENTNDVINLIREIYGSKYLEKEFYNSNVIEYYIRLINYEKGLAWKGIFLKNKLIAQMAAIIENNHVILKLTMIKQEYRNMGLMILLSTSMIKEIDNFRETDFRSIFAFIDPTNLPILKILNKFKFIKVGTVPPYDIGNNFEIYCMVAFDSPPLTITPHFEILKKIKKIIDHLQFRRYIMENKSLSRIFVNNFNYNIIIKQNNTVFPIKYSIFIDNIKCGEYFENSYTYSWYDFKFTKDLSLELKDIILRKMVDRFLDSLNITSFSIIVDINDASLQEILLDLKFNFYAFLPFYLKSNDAILMGTSKIK